MSVTIFLSLIALALFSGCHEVEKAIKMIQEDLENAENARSLLKGIEGRKVAEYLEKHPEYASLGSSKQDLLDKIEAALTIRTSEKEFSRLKNANPPRAVSAGAGILKANRWGPGWTLLLPRLGAILDDVTTFVDYELRKVERKLYAARKKRHWNEILETARIYDVEQLRSHMSRPEEVQEMLREAEEEREKANELLSQARRLAQTLCDGTCREMLESWDCVALYEEALEIAPELEESVGAEIAQARDDREDCIRESYRRYMRGAVESYNKTEEDFQTRLEILQEAKEGFRQAGCIATKFSEYVQLDGDRPRYELRVLEDAIMHLREALENEEKVRRRGSFLKPETAGVGIPIRGSAILPGGGSHKWQGSSVYPARIDLMLQPEDVFCLEVVVETGYLIGYLSSTYDDNLERGSNNILSPNPPIDMGREIDFLSERYGGGPFYLEIRNSLGPSSGNVRCVVYEKHM